MRNLKRLLLHIFFPTKCPVCGDFIDYMDDFCESCKGKLTSFTGTFSVESASSFTAAYEYDEISTKAIILLKNGVCGNSAYAFGKALAELINANGISQKIDIIIPVPLHKSAQRKRGFNQSALIAKEISARISAPVHQNAVVKHKNTSEQKLLSKEERLVNLKGAYSLPKPETFKGKRILLVDDVCTTGSTLAELTKLILKSGAAEVHCAVCCKTPPPARKNANDEV